MWRFYVLMLLFVLSETVSAGSLSKIYICPGDVTLNREAQQQFQVFGLDASGNEVPVPGPITWTANPAAGVISSDGMFTAGATVGVRNGGVTASVPGGLTATAVVEVCDLQPAGGYLFEKSWGGNGPGHLNIPTGIAIAPNGDIYVSDSRNNRIQKFDSNGNHILSWGSKGSGSASQFNGPGEIALDSAGNVYVADSGNNRISKFTPNGEYITVWGGNGSQIGYFNSPSGVAVDQQGNVYVVDTYNHRIQKFNSNGGFITTWGSLGSADGQFCNPSSVAVDSSGSVYVADMTNHRIQKFTSTGTFVTKWGALYEIKNPQSVAVDASGYVYVVSSDLGRIVKYNSQGGLISINNPGNVPLNRTFSPSAVAVSSGSVYVTDSGNNTVQKLDSNGALITHWGSAVGRKGQFNFTSGLTSDRWGNLYVVDRSGHIQVYDSSTQVTRAWGKLGYAQSEFQYPRDLVVGPDNRIYVADADDQYIKVFDLNGNYITRWGGTGYVNGKFIFPWSIDADAQGNIYVSDGIRNCVQKFSSAGAFLRTWHPLGSGGYYVHGICVAPDGTNYVCDDLNETVTRFDESGNRTLTIYDVGSVPGFSGSPTCVEFDAFGNLQVGSLGVIQAYDTSGNYLGYWGKFGSATGQFNMMNDMESDIYGNLYVADTMNNRVHKYIPLNRAISSSKLRRDGEMVSVNGCVVTAGNSEIGDCFYMESEDRSCGIKVTGLWADRGEKLSVLGTLATANGEREIRAISITEAGTGTVQPLMLNNKALGGGDSALLGQPATGQNGVEGGTGANNIGLLVKTMGNITYSGSGFFYVDDGSGLRDGSGHIGVRVAANSFNPPLAGLYAIVTGVNSTCLVDDTLQRLVRTRSAGDVVLFGGSVISGKIVQAANGQVSTLVESPHPYPDNYNYTWTITGPASATRIRVHFGIMEMEYNRDFVYVYDAANVQQAKYSPNGMLFDLWSPWVNGNTAKLKLTSNYSNTRFGFQVDKYEVEGVTSPVAGAAVTLTPGNLTTQTDQQGCFSFTIPSAGTYTITPSLTGATFTPANKVVTVIAGQELTGVDFTKN